MKILYHHRTQGRGAEGVHIREIIKALRKLGHEVFIVSPHGVDISADQADHRFGGDQKVSFMATLHGWVSRHMPQFLFELFEIFYNLSSWFKVRRLISKENVDAVYERYHFFGFSGTFLAGHFGIPIILEVNELSGFERIRGHVFVGMSKAIEKYVFKRASAIIVVSPCLKRTIVELGVSAEKVHVIPNAVNLDDFNKDNTVDPAIKERFSLANRVVIGFVGYLVKWHNLDFLVDCFAEAAVGNQDLQLLIVGDGPLRQALVEQIASRHMENRVIFAGNVKHTEIPHYIQLMDICVIPHSNEYRSPIKMFEYMAMAKPVLVPDTEPILGIIKHGNAGVTFTRENKDSFMAGLRSLTDSREKRNAIGREGYALVASKHCWTHNALIVLELIKRYRHE